MERVAAELGLPEEAVTSELTQTVSALQGNLSAISAARILRLLVEYLSGDFQASLTCRLHSCKHPHAGTQRPDCRCRL